MIELLSNEIANENLFIYFVYTVHYSASYILLVISDKWQRIVAFRCISMMPDAVVFVSNANCFVHSHFHPEFLNIPNENNNPGSETV